MPAALISDPSAIGGIEERWCPCLDFLLGAHYATVAELHTGQWWRHLRP
jgi:hypothetical protein